MTHGTELVQNKDVETRSGEQVRPFHVNFVLSYEM